MHPAPPADPPPRTLVLLIGPPAVGKMTVGRALAARTGLRLFHNHQAIELVLEFFPFGSPPFGRLVHEFRRRIFEEVAASDLPGLVFTYVWAFDEPEDAAFLEETAAIFAARGARTVYVELEASLEERLRRNATELRLAEKPSKRDVAASRERLLALDARHRLRSDGRLDGRADYLRIDNTSLSPEEVAERIVRHFGLPRRPAAVASPGGGEHIVP